MAEPISRPQPPADGPLLEVASFLAVRPPPPAEIYVEDRVRKDPITAKRIAGVVADEVLWKALGSPDTPSESAPRIVRVAWMSGGRELRRVEVAHSYPAVVREVVLAARSLRIPVTCRYQDAGFNTMSTTASYFVARPLPDMGSMHRIVGVEDTPERLDVMFGEVDSPGRVRRLVLRRDEFHEFYRVTLDRSGLVVERSRHKGNERVHVAAAELIAMYLGRGGSNRQIRAFTTTGVVDLPGARGVTGGSGQIDVENWIWARVNQRLGV